MFEVRQTKLLDLHRISTENVWLQSVASSTEKMTKTLGNSSDYNSCFCVNVFLASVCSTVRNLFRSN